MDWSEFHEICLCALNTYRIVRQSVVIGHITEIDESLFGKCKNHVGRHVPGQWVLGGINRHTGECFLQTVQRRDAATLIPIIQANVQPGTTIMTDQWLAYQTLPNF